MIRGIKPQAYDNVTKISEEVLIPAQAIDFVDRKNLETKVLELLDSLEMVKEEERELANVVNKTLPVPKQLGTLIYNGELQSPTFDVKSSRILISGDTVKKEAGGYVALATIYNGQWNDPSLEKIQPITWTIEKKKIPKPFVTGFYVVDGTVHKVQLCNYDSNYCTVIGKTEERSVGTYNIIVKLKNPNVVWDDGTSDDINLSWKIVEIASNNSSDETVPTALIAKISEINTLLQTLQQNVEKNRSDIDSLFNLGTGSSSCSCGPTLRSIKRRLEILEFFFLQGDLGNFDMDALIALLTEQVTQLERQAKDMSYSDLEAEATALITLIDKALLKATKQEHTDALNALKLRVQNLFSVYAAGQKLKEFEQELEEKRKQIKLLLEQDDIDEAERLLLELKQKLEEILEGIDDRTKRQMQEDIEKIQDKLFELEQEIAQKEIQKLLDQIEGKLDELQRKINDNEDTTALVQEIEELFRQVKKKIEPYNLPFEQDRILALENRFDKLKGQGSILQQLEELIAKVKDLKDNMNSYTNQKISEDIAYVEQKLPQVRTAIAALNSSSLNVRLQILEDDFAEVKLLFWKKQKEEELLDIKRQLEDIRAAIIAGPLSDSNVLLWNNQVHDLELTVDDIERQAVEKGVTLDNLAAVRQLINLLKDMLVTTDIQKILDALSAELDALEASMMAGTISYDQVKLTLDDISRRISEIENDSLPETALDAIAFLKARVTSLRQLNEDMKIYLEVKPILNSIRQRIYDEDLDILWSELNGAKEKVNNGGTSRWITELKAEIAELENILNSFGKDNTVNGFLGHLDMALQIIITTDIFSPSALTYDEAKTTLENLEKISVMVENEEMLAFPGWYSLVDADKAYLLENNLRKLRRKVITTEDTFTA